MLHDKNMLYMRKILNVELLFPVVSKPLHNFLYHKFNIKNLPTAMAARAMKMTVFMVEKLVVQTWFHK